MFELFKISEWIITDYGNWKLKDNAPKEVRKIFNEFQKTYDDALKKGGIVE